MTSFFGGKDKAGGAAAENERVSRHSSGWGQLLQRMRGEESLRVLDIGPTSSTNINFITSLGHSIYLANLVEDAAKHDWTLPQEDGKAVRLDVERFLAAHLNFSGRGFDVVLFWDTADYLPQELLSPVLERIHAVMVPEGQMLAMFHPPTGASASGAAKTDFHRYHLTDRTRWTCSVRESIRCWQTIRTARLSGCSSRSRDFISSWPRTTCARLWLRARWMALSWKLAQYLLSKHVTEL